MLKQTDERYVPWSDDLCTGYEHIHRYLLAKRYATDAKVLDLACGEGYGSWFLSQTAKQVVGIDICAESIQHALNTYKKPNLSFCLGSITDVPIGPSEKFDLIVCFEALEHIAGHNELLKEVKRLLSEEGIFIVSTPNKPIYSENGTRQNPYHVKELEFNEFEALLKDYFNHAMFFGQKTYAASKIFPMHPAPNALDEYLIQKENNGYAVAHADDPSPRYFIAVTSNRPLIDMNIKSYLTDISARCGYIKWEPTQCEETMPLTMPTVKHHNRIKQLFSKVYKKIFQPLINTLRFKSE